MDERSRKDNLLIPIILKHIDSLSHCRLVLIPLVAANLYCRYFLLSHYCNICNVLWPTFAMCFMITSLTVGCLCVCTVCEVFISNKRLPFFSQIFLLITIFKKINDNTLNKTKLKVFLSVCISTSSLK